ncbi:uncharacterized protein C12orf50 homolog [Cyrtonyx montezumae]|uniref:uncharacterized protein C12orf50 homolog n=1 Tax=Cyrtonyx montezumae TaxID=9017 RepID=UPI0032DB7B66
MDQDGNDHSYSPPHAQQKYSNTLCFWETKPLGCVRIDCSFQHSKPRLINGLFLPPTVNTVVQQQGQEGILISANSQELYKIQGNILIPIHPQVIVDLSNEDDEDEDEEEDEDNSNTISVTREKTAEEIEEERAIMEVCYKSGEYYRVQYPQVLQSGEIAPPPPGLGSEKLAMDTVEQDSGTGDSNMKRERETSGMEVSVKQFSRTDDKSCENKGGGYFAPQRNKYFNGKQSEPVYFEKAPTTSKYSNEKSTDSAECVRKYHFKGVKKNNWISEEQRNSPNAGTGKGTPTSYSKVKPNYQQNYRRRDDGTTSSIGSVRQTERNIYFNSPEPKRSAYVSYRGGRVIQEPMYNGYTHKYYSASYSAPTWKKRNPHAKTFF